MGKYNTRCATKRTQRNVIVSKEILPPGPDDEISTTIESNKKRKASKSSVECEKEVKRSKKTSSTHDKYCWKCHKVDAEIGCSTCPRAFHPSCVKAKINDDGSCFVCQQESIAKATSNIDDEYHLSQLLLHIIDTACPMDREEFKPIVNWPDSEGNEKLICKKDFRLIHDRCSQKGIQYESPEELVNDVKWIHHNCIIIYGDKSLVAKTAKKVLEAISLELNDAIDCPECYLKKIGNESLSFLHMCKTPHPLVWAKVKFYPYWPAKCLRILNGKAHVRFFRTHQMSKVPLTNVLALSKEYPASNAGKKPDKKSKISVDFYLAEKELDAYIDIFQDHYGSFPYEPINTPFDFEKEENILKDLLENHSRRRMLSGDTFQSPADDEAGSRPALVDLTGDASEDDEDQSNENVASPIHETQNLFAENSSKTVESIEQAISGSLLPSHHSLNSVDHQNLNWLSQPSGISISNVISGTEVPLDTNADLLVGPCVSEPALHNNFVMSMPSAESDPFQTNSTFSQNSISSSNSMQLCLRNYDRTSETGGFSAYPHNDDNDIEIIDEVSSSNAKTKIQKNDTECILQTILRHDPRSFLVLKQANLLVQQLFIQFWGSSTKLKTPEKIIQSQECEIHNLKSELEEMRKQISLMKEDYEDRLQNADKVLKSLSEKKSELTKKLKDKEEELKRNNEKVEELQKKNEKKSEFAKKHEEELKKSNEKVKELQRQIGQWEKIVEDNDKKNAERVKDAKTFRYCNKCLKLLSNKSAILCCYSGIYSYAYCSEACKKADDFHQSECKAEKKVVGLKAKERDISAGQVTITRGIVQQSCQTITVVKQSVETHSVKSHITNNEITSPNTPQQTSSGNVKGYKVVSAAKKTIELGRNINRNQNSPDIY